MSGLTRRLLGLDNAAATGEMSLRVRWLDDDRPDQDATARGVVRVSERSVVWQLEGRTRGERPWPDLTGWTQLDGGNDTSQLVMTCEGEFVVGDHPENLHVTVGLKAPSSAVSLLTKRAERFLAPDLVEVRPDF